MATLAVQEKRGNLVPIEDVAAAQRQVADVIVRALEGYAARSAELVAAVLKDGEIGARRVAKAHTVEVRRVIAAEIWKLAAPGF